MRQFLYYQIPEIKNGERQYRKFIKQDIARITEESLSRLLDYLIENNPYYAPILKKSKNLNDLPILTKQIIQENFDALISQNNPRHTYRNSSGGSTGKPQTFIQDNEYLMWSRLSEAYYYRVYLGIDPVTTKKVVLWGSERDTFKQLDIKGKLANYLTKTFYLNTFKVSELDWLNYIKIINKEKPYFIKGYAGSLYQICRVAKKHSIPLFQPKFVYSSAETLQDFMRKEIEEVFSAKVYNFYGSREVGPIAGECAHGNMHIFTFNNLVEVMDDQNRPVKSGEPGKLLITNLHNYSMPLVRYEIGDMAILGETSCRCGSPLPWLKEIKGRITDHFIKKDGTLIHGEYFTHLFYHRDWIEEFQVNQVDYHKVNILVVTKKMAMEKDIKEINDKIYYVLGKECEVKWEFVKEIPKTPQGKHLFTRCTIKIQK